MLEARSFLRSIGTSIGFAASCLILSASQVSADIKAFTFYTYHDKPPYYTQSDGPMESLEPGIYRRFATYLNARQDKISIRIEFLPRVRLENRLEAGNLNGAVIGVNPLWFKDREEQRFLWSGAFMIDRDVVVTRSESDIQYRKPEDLSGLSMALPRGLYFWGVTELIKAGRIEMFPTSSDNQDFKMLLYGRVDATITSILTYHHFRDRLFKESQLRPAEVPHDRFERRILFPKSERLDFHVLSPLIQQALSDPDWIEQLSRYHYAEELTP